MAEIATRLLIHRRLVYYNPVAIISPYPSVRTLTAAEVRALKDVPPDPLEKEKLIDALWGCMSEEEADAFEARINAFNECEYDGDHVNP